jgi:hypothetical protein
LRQQLYFHVYAPFEIAISSCDAQFSAADNAPGKEPESSAKRDFSMLLEAIAQRRRTRDAASK